MKVIGDQMKSEWVELPPMQSQREGGAAVAIYGSKILVVGGYHAEKKFLKSCVVFDLETKEWSDFPPMKYARMGCAAVFLEQHNAVVVVGGFQRGRKYLNTAEYLDLSTLHWHRLPPMNHPRAGCAAVTVLGKRAVVLGGWMDGETAVGTVEVLDFSAHQWHSLPEMGTPRAGCSAAAIGHRVFVLGGHTTSGRHRGCRASVEVLDLSTQKWSRMPSMKERRDASASCAVGNHVLILGGGETSAAPTSSVEILDVDQEVWKDMPRMKYERFGCAAAAVGNRIVVLGGRGVDGRHLESVECLELRPSSPNEGNDTIPGNCDENGDIGISNNVTEHDRSRINGNYDSASFQAQEIYQRTKDTLEERLRALEKERENIQELMKQAQGERDEAVAKAERERREALTELEKTAQAQKAASMVTGTGVSNETTPQNDAEEIVPPSELCCCITGDLMEDPVTAMDGHTYEREAIETWFARFDASTNPTSPLTNESLPNRLLMPSHNIRSQCKTWKEKLGMQSPAVSDPLAGIISKNGSISSHNRTSTPPPNQSSASNGNRSPVPVAAGRSQSDRGKSAQASITRQRTRGSSLRRSNNQERPNNSSGREQGRDRTPSRNARGRQPAATSNRRGSGNSRANSRTRADAYRSRRPSNGA